MATSARQATMCLAGSWRRTWRPTCASATMLSLARWPLASPRSFTKAGCATTAAATAALSSKARTISPSPSQTLGCPAALNAAPAAPTRIHPSSIASAWPATTRTKACRAPSRTATPPSSPSAPSRAAYRATHEGNQVRALTVYMCECECMATHARIILQASFME